MPVELPPELKKLEITQESILNINIYKNPNLGLFANRIQSLLEQQVAEEKEEENDDKSGAENTGEQGDIKPTGTNE